MEHHYSTSHSALLGANFHVPYMLVSTCLLLLFRLLLPATLLIFVIFGIYCHLRFHCLDTSTPFTAKTLPMLLWAALKMYLSTTYCHACRRLAVGPYPNPCFFRLWRVWRVILRMKTNRWRWWLDWEIWPRLPAKFKQLDWTVMLWQCNITYILANLLHTILLPFHV